VVGLGALALGVLVLRFGGEELRIGLGCYCWLMVWLFVFYRREIQEAKDRSGYYLIFIFPFLIGSLIGLIAGAVLLVIAGAVWLLQWLGWISL
jgi:hypothetical protein